MSDTKHITVAMIAKEAGVSPATVSRVLNHRELVKPEKIELVESALEALGVPKAEWNIPAPQSQRDVLIINLPNTTNIFYLEVIQGAKASASAHGCHLIIHQSPIGRGTIDEFCDLIKSVNAKGVILLNRVSTEYLDRIHSLVPLIQCCEYNTEANYPYVSIDDFSAALQAVEYLISRGRNKIAFINGPLSFKYARERRRGFLQGLANAQLTIPATWVVQLPEVDYDMAYAAASKILIGDRIPNAFFATSDTMAAAVIRAALKYQYEIPKDIMVVGFDNTFFSSMITPTITTISQPKFQEGFSACEMLIEAINDPIASTKALILDTELIIRESTT